MFRFSLKWFLLGTSAIGILSGTIGKRLYDDWQRHEWLAAQRRIHDAITAVNGDVVVQDGAVIEVRLGRATDHRCIAMLAGATELRELLADIPASDADYLWLQGHPRLRTLRVMGNGVTDRTLERIATCRQLTDVGIAQTSITDDGLSHLRRLESLENLTLGKTKLSGSGLKYLERLPRLQILRLINCPISDESLEHVGKLRCLTSLDLMGTAITGAGVPQLSELQHLKTLSLDRTPLIRGDGFAVLDGVTRVTLSESHLGPGVLHGAAQMDSLESLFLTRVDVTDDLLAELKDARQIRKLFLTQTSITDAGLVHLENLKQLRVVMVRQTKVTPEGAYRLSQALPNTTIFYGDGYFGPKWDPNEDP